MKSIFSLSIRTFFAFALTFLFGAFASQAAGAPDQALVVGVAFSAVSFAVAPGLFHLKGSLAVSTITIADLITEYGAYYSAGSQSLKDLRVALMQQSVSEGFFTPRLTTATRIELANAQITRVLQAYQKAFTPISDTSFTPQVIKLDNLKIDVSIVPHDLMESWLGFLALNALKPEDCPIVKYWLENLVIPKYNEDLEMNEFFYGKTGAVTAGTATAPGASMNGVREKLKQTGVQVITMGAVPTVATEFVEYVEDFRGTLPELAKRVCKRIAMAPVLEQRFAQGMREKYNVNYAQVSDKKTIIDTDCQVVGLPSQTGHGVIWTTPEDNKIIANKNPENQGIFDLQKQGREIQALTDFHKGVGFWNPALVFRSDISLVA